MLSVSQYQPSLFSSIHYYDAMDPSGTINPAALNTPASSTVSPNLLHQSSPRGRKRSRSPEQSLEHQGDGDDTKSRKRGRPAKHNGVDSPITGVHPLTPATPGQMQTPHIQTTGIKQSSPNQTSPAQSTPTSGGKQPVLKALPTVRDHTTDELNPERDEYLPREKDDVGETKVSANGNLVDREYRIRTFNVPHRGDKLFMLATECARVLGYRDSYLLFNKNRSLCKIIATQAEKDNLIHQEILPYSYRSRQIAIVTARSMFRQFGSRVIVNGRRVRDDYWESKARKQGFTEEDAAGEKRPGATKQREAAAAEASGATSTLTALPHGEIIYSNAHGLDGPPVPPGIHPSTLASIPMINSISPDDLRPQDYPHVIRPRQEISGPAYHDRTLSSNATDILAHASSAAEYNKNMTGQRAMRSTYYEDYWKRPHEEPTPPQQHVIPDLNDLSTVAPQSLHSPQGGSNMGALSAAHLSMMQQQHHPQLMNSHAYAQQHAQAQSMLAQSPVRTMHQALPSAAQMQSSPAMSMASMPGRQQTPSYSYSGGQAGMWPPSQAQPSPHAMQQYAQQQQRHTPQPHQSPMHPPAQLHHQGSSQMGYPASMNAMANSNVYAGMRGGMYQASPGPQQFNMPGQQQQQQQQQQGMHGWTQGGGMADWQRYQ